MAFETTHHRGDFAVQIVPTGRWKENCYVVRHQPSGEQLLIDPGADEDKIIPLIESGGGTLKWILLTHAHYDHVGAVASLSEKYELPCRLHRDDKRLLLHAPMYGIRWDRKKIRPIKDFVTFEEDPHFELGGCPIELIRCPGHTKGGVSYGMGDFVFTGDTLLYKRVGRTDLPGGDEGVLRASVTHVLQHYDEHVLIFGGHGKPWTVAEARRWWEHARAAPPKFDMPTG